jgi:DNA-binding MarR family transcriptional regulator
MVVHPTDLDLSLLTLFTGWALSAEIQRRLAADGHPDLRINDGVVIQHVLAEPLSITDLATRMGVTQQAASKAAADLERRGLLTRRPSPTDARAKHLHLTAAGEAAVRAARSHRATLEKELTTRFGADRVSTTRALLVDLLATFDTNDTIRSRRVRPPA